MQCSESYGSGRVNIPEPRLLHCLPLITLCAAPTEWKFHKMFLIKGKMRHPPQCSKNKMFRGTQWVNPYPFSEHIAGSCHISAYHPSLVDQPTAFTVATSCTTPCWRHNVRRRNRKNPERSTGLFFKFVASPQRTALLYSQKMTITVHCAYLKYVKKKFRRWFRGFNYVQTYRIILPGLNIMILFHFYSFWGVIICPSDILPAL